MKTYGKTDMKKSRNSRFQTERGPGNSGRRDRYKSSDRNQGRSPLKMYSAVCDKCGKKCEVPFNPTAGKPVFCKECFVKDDSKPRKGSDELKQINLKLDKIMKSLGIDS
jgi:CxxC-x17-CxxC domain-containing protein